MTNKETILMDIQNHNDAGDMDFNKWMMWGITKIVIMTAMILDNVENMGHKVESEEISDTNLKMWQEIFKAESDHKCHTCKHYTSGERDGSCGSYICKGYSNWESEVQQ